MKYIDQNYERAYAKCYLSKGKYEFYPKVYGKTEYMNGKIVAVPEAPVPIVIYDVEAQTVSYVDYKIEFDGFPGKMFSGAIKKGNYLFFVPCCYDSFIRLDIDSFELKYYPLMEYYQNGQPMFTWDGYIDKGKELWFSSFANNIIWAFIMKKEL